MTIQNQRWANHSTTAATPSVTASDKGSIAEEQSVMDSESGQTGRSGEKFYNKSRRGAYGSGGSRGRGRGGMK